MWQWCYFVYVNSQEAEFHNTVTKEMAMMNEYGYVHVKSTMRVWKSADPSTLLSSLQKHNYVFLSSSLFLSLLTYYKKLDHIILGFRV